MDIKAFLDQAKSVSPQELEVLMHNEMKRILALSQQESDSELKDILVHVKNTDVKQGERAVSASL